MFLLPLGHEHHEARRWPWITTAILVLNVLVFVGSCESDRRTTRLVEERAQVAQLYCDTHPYLEQKSPMVGVLTWMRVRKARDASDATLHRLRDRIAEAVGSEPFDPGLRAKEQATLDRLFQDVDDALHRYSFFAWGYTPKDNNVLGLVSHQFMHGGVLHLLGNLWFLWLVGCNIEDGWGRGVFPVFYLVAGILAALSHKLLAWSSPIPLVGASGAIAGSMGAFLVRHAKTKIRFFALLFFRPIVFRAPAWLMLPLWLIAEILDGVAASALPFPGMGVAHWAHVGGFVFGLGFALVMRHSGLERRIDAAIERSETVVQDPRLASAAELVSTGRAVEAVAALEELAAEQPGSADVRLELLRAADAAGDVMRARLAKAELIEIHLHDQAGDAALDLYDEIVAEDARQAIAPSSRIRIARHLERLGQFDRAVCEYCEIYKDANAGAVALAAMIGHGEVSLKEGRNAEATALFGYALENLKLDPDLEPVIRRGLARAASGTRAEAEDRA